MSIQSRRGVRALVAAASAGVLIAACVGCEGYVGAGGSSLFGGDAINVLMVNNPQMTELQKLTKRHFTRSTGIKVNFTVLPENDVRDKISQDFSNQAGQYDVATISNFEVPFFSRHGWLRDLGPYLADDPAFDQQDVLAPVRQSLTAADGKVYAEPFYGESSFLMYRKDVFAERGLTMPTNPTWQQVAELAADLDGARPGMKGICLRGMPGWGELTAPLTTVVNTFGGTWFDQGWQARLTAPEFVNATEFYVDLVRKHGESGAAQSGYAECLLNMVLGKTAMWYDATAAAGSLEGPESRVKGKIGYVKAPVNKTTDSGWLYTWAWGMQKASKKSDDAWRFISWASSKEYEELVGRESGWANVPAGKRASTYARPEYRAAARAFADITHRSIAATKPRDPGVQPRPAAGIQFVGIPEFTDLGTKVSQEISSAIAGRQSVRTALRASQRLAEQVGEEYQDR
ncbi:sugar ABC transporter substrate-binding protein [Streptomyces sp. HSW2009]|uniref:ABC transporter substrate-binding protein n=1 Tax=Streptomyces sp. HSW2009 TaxID=3142890 RepID=UPI0032F00E47